MGFSFAYNSPVAPLLLLRAGNTLILTITSTLLAWALALPLGIGSAEPLGHLPACLLSWEPPILLVFPTWPLPLGLLSFPCGPDGFRTGGMPSIDLVTF